MSILEILKSIMSSGIHVSGRNIPTAHLRYYGKSDEYIIWSVVDSFPVLNADDDYQYEIYYVDIDIYSKTGYMDILRTVKDLLKNNGWIWVENSTEMYDEETKTYHICSTYKKGSD